jgi:hypothetical protein
LTKFTRLHALTVKSTPTRDQVIHFLDFVILSSSPAETTNITQEIIKEITATTAAYLIHSAITFHKKLNAS